MGDPECMRTACARLLLALFVAGACGVGGCASRSAGIDAAPMVDAPAVTAPVESELASLERIGAGILSGIAVASSRDDWQIGDRVLIGIRAAKPEKVTTRLLLVELLDHLAIGKDFEIESGARSGGKQRKPLAFTSPCAATRLTVFDETGAKVNEAIGRFPIKLLGYGPLDGSLLLPTCAIRSRPTRGSPRWRMPSMTR